MQVKQPKLYGLVLFFGLVLVIVGLGGGLFNQSEPWMGQWQHNAFYTLCHQMPDRSYWMNNQPMAVCSRCIGIYSGFALGWILLFPLGYKGQQSISWMKNLTVILLLVNFIDAGGDIMGYWQNTLLSRTILGSMLGGAAALIFIEDFFHHNINKRGSLWMR